MASGMIIPSGKTYFDVEILVKAPIPISPANVILNMLEIDDSHNPEEQVVRTYTSAYCVELVPPYNIL